MKWLRIGGIVVAVCVALIVVALGGMLAFGKAKPPAVATEFGDPFRRVDYSDLLKCLAHVSDGGHAQYVRLAELFSQCFNFRPSHNDLH